MPIVLRGWNWGQWGSVQPQDATDNLAQGANAVRIPLRWWGSWGDTTVDARSDASPGHVDPAHLALLDGVIKEATDQRLWVVLFVDSNCGQASLANDTVAVCGTGTDGTAANFENDPAAKQEFAEVWAFLAARYANTPYIGMYEILPEPNFTCSPTGCTDWSTAPRFYASIIPTLRAVDPRTPILVGADSGYDIRKIETAYIPGVEGLVYTGDLLSFGASNPSFVTAATDFRTAHDVPFFIQQVGVRQSDANAQATTQTILSLLNTDGIGWTWWTYRETKSTTGMGFAPFWQDKGGPWSENAAWLALIDGNFR
jgi:aryl-phospho-beta-D-glucosidase BglC (GH1 family)